jgi:hypothetical protein
MKYFWHLIGIYNKVKVFTLMAAEGNVHILSASVYCLLPCIIITVFVSLQRVSEISYFVVDPILCKYVPKQRTWMSVSGKTMIT